MPTDSHNGNALYRLQHTLQTGPERCAEPPAIGASSLQEALSSSAFDTAATAFVLAALEEAQAPLLWVQDRMSRREFGRINTPGLTGLKDEAHVLHVAVNNARDVLWAMEEGASCAGLGGVLGEIHGGPAVLDFTATKRLVLRSEASGVPVWLIRSGDTGGLSAARERWRVSTHPSTPHIYDPQAPGHPAWQAELFRARSRPPGTWTVHHDPSKDRKQDRLRLVSQTRHATLDDAAARERTSHAG